ncbi:hypothetical protein AEAC466_07390 [Asticcacaulis sp. AC466]|uniref:flavin monoamine oxidase family protein n=1 Tax=Asticcacaulis sp. AC466 TaxID=1282362 RepID=UPI0003C3BD86|nr:NAD(P)/FAD-dependent oxidoreductase [Asticcacaulis sp. AC466]ESQ84872.1 hypothetical protein AEAC466_07390 [Asticcacaulis sp. AC466]
MTDILIIGAGMAGLAAALELQRHSLDFLILEAASEPGGRAATVTTPTGTPVDLGAHWLHGDGTPLKALIEEYGIGYREDRSDNLTLYEGGRARQADGDWLEGLLDVDKAHGIKSGTVPDCPLPELAKDARGRKVLTEFGLMWNGVDPPVYPSAHEFLTDENTVGGLQPDGGIGMVIASMAEAVGDRILYDTHIAEILTQEDIVEVRSAENDIWTARYVLFTGSLGVLKSGDVAFDPPFSEALTDHLAGLVMGDMNKIVVEVEPGFFEARGIAPDTALELLDASPPHFCHIRSAGQPLISLYISGRQAEAVEGFTGAEALGYLRTILAPVEALTGFEAHTTGDVILSHWSGNPLTRGAYSACLPGHRRSTPWLEGRVCFCGDTFDTRFPASLAGAFRSGRKAARQIATFLG